MNELSKSLAHPSKLAAPGGDGERIGSETRFDPWWITTPPGLVELAPVVVSFRPH